MKEKVTRKKHSVKANVQILDLTRAGSSMQLDIFSGGEKLGTVQLGQGTVNWIGRNRKVWGKPINWTKFAEIMSREAYGDGK